MSSALLRAGLQGGSGSTQSADRKWLNGKAKARTLLIKESGYKLHHVLALVVKNVSRPCERKLVTVGPLGSQGRGQVKQLDLLSTACHFGTF